MPAETPFTVRDLVKPLSEELSKRLNSSQNESLAKTIDKSLERFSKSFLDKLEKSNFIKAVNSSNKEGKTSQLEEIDQPKPFLFAGFTDQGYKELHKKLPEILKDIIDTKKVTTEPTQKDPKKGGGWGSLLLGGLGIVGGLLTLLAGLQTSGPLKGLAKLVGKGAIEIGKFLLKPLESFFGAALDFVLGIPKKLLKNVKSFFKIGEKTVASKIASKTGQTFLSKFLGGALKFFKRVPIVGSLISIGFAYSRFKNGDLVGGGIEVLSGIAGLFPGIGTGISLALDVLNAVLDLKAGGSDAKASGKKVDILKEWFGAAAGFLQERAPSWPIIGPLIKAYEAFKSYEWGKGLKYLAYSVPAIEYVAALFGDDDVTPVVKTAADATKSGASSIGQVWEKLKPWIAENCYDLPIIGNLIKAFQAFGNDEWIEGFKQLAYCIPGAEVIGAIFGDKKTSSAAQWAGGAAVDISTKIGNFFGDLINQIIAWFVNQLPEYVGWGSFKFNIRSKVAGWLGVSTTGSSGNSSSPASNSGITDISNDVQQIKPGETGTRLPQQKDALIDPEGGVIVSSPKFGGFGVQLDKRDGLLAAPLSDGSTKEGDSKLTDSLLQAIANNTNGTNQNIIGLIRGFNGLATALQNTLGKDVKVPQVVPVNSTQPKPPTSSQIAQQGNLDIFNFRKNIVEGDRFQPA